MLTFNPFFRITADQALNHPFFDDVNKQAACNSMLVGAPIKTDIESGKKTDVNQVRSVFEKELSSFKSKL